MNGHLRRVRDTVDAQLGRELGRHLVPSDKPVVMNKIPALDAMYEIVVDGYIVGRLRFDIPERHYVFLPTVEGARRAALYTNRKRVVCESGVLEYLKKGASLLRPGVVACDPQVAVGDEVWVRVPSGEVVAVGTARMTGVEIAAGGRGVAVKVREAADPTPPKVNPKSATWDDAVRANENDLRRAEREALAFIRRTVERIEAPVVVGFSGGKDSLVAYLLVEKALGYSPPLFFINTGLEFPETVAYVHEFAHKRGVEIVGKEAGDRFWESLATFGPPARDFRWCCKVLKLGPAATTIAEALGSQSLSFMGQRRLESFQRSVEPRVTNNPWVPGQTSANPIRNWNALEVWLYIFRERAEFNPLYLQGYHRLGCYLCPSSPLEELEGLSRTHPQMYSRWTGYLYRFAEEHGLPREWADLGFWRWKRLPSGQLKLAREMGVKIAPERGSPKQELQLEVVRGVSPCVSAGYSVEGQFTQGLDLARLAQLMPVFGPTRYSEDLGVVHTRRDRYMVMLFSSGSVTVRGPGKDGVMVLLGQVERVVRRALFCQGCGSCIPKCRHGALSLQNGQIVVDPDRCTNCLGCDGWPCPTYLE